MQIRPVIAELFHADRWTDGRDEANSRFSQFCERALKKTETNNEALCGDHVRPSVYLWPNIQVFQNFIKFGIRVLLQSA